MTPQCYGPRGAGAPRFVSIRFHAGSSSAVISAKQSRKSDARCVGGGVKQSSLQWLAFGFTMAKRLASAVCASHWRKVTQSRNSDPNLGHYHAPSFCCCYQAID